MEGASLGVSEARADGPAPACALPLHAAMPCHAASHLHVHNTCSIRAADDPKQGHPRSIASPPHHHARRRIRVEYTYTYDRLAPTVRVN